MRARCAGVCVIACVALWLNGCNVDVPEMHVRVVTADDHETSGGMKKARVVCMGERLGIIPGGVEREEIREIVSAIEKRLGEKVHPSSVQVVAWACKASVLNIPPRVSEEIIVSFSFADRRKWGVMYLVRDRTKTEIDPLAGEWQEGTTDFTESMLWRDTFPQDPSGKNLADFITKTNFGNNEFFPDTAPAITVLISPRDKMLCKTLADGITLEERKSRFDRYQSLIGE